MNALPHISFALEPVRADVLARFHRMRGEPVFLTVTDEHGAKVVKVAGGRQKIEGIR